MSSYSADALRAQLLKDAERFRNLARPKTFARTTKTETTDKIKSDEQINTEQHDNDQQNQQQYRRLRTATSYWVISIVSLYLIAIAVLMFYIFLCGEITTVQQDAATITSYKYYLSDKVLIALLTTTTATVIGLPLVVIKGLFAQDKRNAEKDV